MVSSYLNTLTVIAVVIVYQGCSSKSVEIPDQLNKTASNNSHSGNGPSASAIYALELHVSVNKMALVKRKADQSIDDCQLFGSSEFRDALLQTLADVSVITYKDVNVTDFMSLLHTCENVEIDHLPERRSHLEAVKGMTKQKLEQHYKKAHSGHGRDREERASLDLGFTVIEFAAIYPGTKWCGAGNVAENFAELGLLSNVDSCCRTHDHCDRSISSFTTDPETGLFNFAIYTKSHCDCDREFKQCFKDSTSSDADNIGSIFFDLLDAECFEENHPYECLDRAWWGWCNDYGLNYSKAKEWYFIDDICYVC